MRFLLRPRKSNDCKGCTGCGDGFQSFCVFFSSFYPCCRDMLIRNIRIRTMREPEKTNLFRRKWQHTQHMRIRLSLSYETNGFGNTEGGDSVLPRETVLRALKTPYKRVLDFAFTYVSLSKPEETCIRCVIIDGMTEEEAAEALGYSRDYIAKHKAKGIRKLQQAWEGCEVLPILTEYE